VRNEDRNPGQESEHRDEVDEVAEAVYDEVLPQGKPEAEATERPSVGQERREYLSILKISGLAFVCEAIEGAGCQCRDLNLLLEKTKSG